MSDQTAGLRRAAPFVPLLAACVIALAAGALAWRMSLREIDDRLDQTLILTLRALETEIDRFRYLPGVTAEDARVRAAILRPDDPATIDAANRYLQTVTRLAGASHLYLMDATGRTLAASNWNVAESFVGQSYAFRPYFREAIETGAGGFYAIGVTTKTPGYFLSARVDLPGEQTGVLVVKLDLMPLQQAWVSARQATAVADTDGVVFLSGVADWVYRPLRPLSDAALTRLRAERTYSGIALDQARPLQVRGAEWLFDGAGERLRAGAAPFGRDWQVIAAAPVRAAIWGAAGWGAGAALAFGLGLGLAKIQRQRRQLIRLQLAQAEVLEQKVAKRTARLAREIEARRETEKELRAAQEGLIQSEKMAALGRMSAAIVHEISQPLAAMEATLAAAEMSLDSAPEKTAPRIGTARQLIHRMQRTIKHLKAFSRKESGPRSLICLSPILDSALELVAPRARAVGVVPELAEVEPGLFADAGQVRLEQVLVNLLLNALDAVEGQPGARVWLEARRRGGEIRLEVHDTGPGIDPEDLERVTEPFFSTKTQSEGLGLGLAISQAILTEFGGRLEITSQPGEGTVMVAVLPAAEQGGRG